MICGKVSPGLPGEQAGIALRFRHNGLPRPQAGGVPEAAGTATE